jgi:hypothetical protein
MAATVGGAIRDLIVADGIVNERVWADEAPEKATLPYVTIYDAVATGPQLQGDQRTLMLVRTVQVDLWEDKGKEHQDNARRVVNALDGARLSIGDATTTRVSVDDTQRFSERDTNIVHRAFTLTIRHDPTAF